MCTVLYAGQLAGITCSWWERNASRACNSANDIQCCCWVLNCVGAKAGVAGAASYVQAHLTLPSVHALHMQCGLLKSVTRHQAQKRGIYAVIGALATAHCRGWPGQIQHVRDVSPSVVVHQTRGPCSETGSAGVSG